jgi:hypothetical protein
MNRKNDQKVALYSMLILISLSAYPLLNTVQAADTISRHYSWSYGGATWTWDLAIPSSLYDQYRSVSDYDRTRRGVGGYSLLVTTKDSYVSTLSSKLHEAAVDKGYGPYDEVSFILAFVQSLQYTSDSVTTGYDEYPRFPVETLVDNGGDCEDTSILFATLVAELGYGVLFISPPSHVAVGVKGSSLPGSYYTYEGNCYYYCETTGDNWRIGDLPKEYKNISATLYSINVAEQYVAGQGTSTQSGNAAVDLLMILGFGFLLYMVHKRARDLNDINPAP